MLDYNKRSILKQIPNSNLLICDRYTYQHYYFVLFRPENQTRKFVFYVEEFFCRDNLYLYYNNLHQLYWKLSYSRNFFSILVYCKLISKRADRRQNYRKFLSFYGFSVEVSPVLSHNINIAGLRCPIIGVIDLASDHVRNCPD